MPAVGDQHSFPGLLHSIGGYKHEPEILVAYAYAISLPRRMVRRTEYMTLRVLQPRRSLSASQHLA